MMRQSLCEISQVFLSRERDISVVTALSAQEGLELLNTSPFDVIVSDYQMPQIDGIKFLTEVKAHRGNLPFILFTGRGREEIVIKALNAGADSYLQKGGDPKSQFVELSHRIRQVVARISPATLRKRETHSGPFSNPLQMAFLRLTIWEKYYRQTGVSQKYGESLSRSWIAAMTRFC